MITLLSPHFTPQQVTEDDLIIASLAWGFTIGFGWLTTWTAIKQTRHIAKKSGSRAFRNAYVWMIWLEILVCLIFGIMCFLHLKGFIPPSFAFYFCILTTWALQVQFLLQIIINRCSILLTDRKWAMRLKVGVAVFITAINVSVYVIWIPARLQISEKYIWINEWWDRCEKVLYLIVDAFLNLYFVRIIQVNLVTRGMIKYRSLVKFNMLIIGFSLGMDVLIISMMSLKNTFVYMQFHPFAYLVKLKIEMSMADLIAKVARKRDYGVITEDTFSHAANRGPGATMQSNALKSMNRNRSSMVREISVKSDAASIELQDFPDGSPNHYQQDGMGAAPPGGRAIYTTQEISVDVESAPSSFGSGSVASFNENGGNEKDDEIQRLRPTETADKKSMGLQTNIWANDTSGVRVPPPSWKG